MVRSVKILRILLPILFVAFIGILVLSFTRNNVRGQAITEPITSTIRQDDDPQLVAYTFEDVQTVGGRVVSRIRARRTMGFVSGWYTLEDVHLTIYRNGSASYELSAPQAQFHSQTREAEAEGGVRITSEDGLEIETASINFDGSRLVNRIPVRFKADGWTGRAGAVDLHVDSQHLRLFESVEASRQAPGQPLLTIRADEADFDRTASEATFTGEVVVDRTGDTIESDTLTARVDPGKKVLTGLEGCCGVEFTLSPGSPLAPDAGAGRTVVSGERFFTEVGPAGEIRAIFVDGGSAQAMTVMSGPPRRTLRAGQFRVLLGAEGVSELEASGAARFEEAGAVSRSLSGSKMVTYFDPLRQRPNTAVIEGNLEYRDPENRATSQRGTFNFVTEKVVLASVPGVLPAMESDRHKLTAQQIEINPKSGILTAEGFVKARFVSRSGASSLDPSGIFPATRNPVYVNADKLILQQAEQAGEFSGNVRAWQDDNILLSQKMRIEQGGETLVARGEVRAVLYNAGERENGGPVKASGDTLTVRRSDRQALLEGSVRIEDQGRVLTGESAVFHFDSQQKLERVEAEGEVEIAERASERSGEGARLVYSIPKKMINLEGSPATVTDPRGSVKGREIVFDLANNRVTVLRGDDQTEATYKPEDAAQ